MKETCLFCCCFSFLCSRLLFVLHTVNFILKKYQSSCTVSLIQCLVFYMHLKLEEWVELTKNYLKLYICEVNSG